MTAETSPAVVALPDRTLAKYNFRENKDTKAKRPSVELDVPKIGVAEAAGYLSSENAKTVELVLDTLQGVLNAYIRSAFVDSDEAFDQAKLDALIADGKVGLEVIANLPRSERNVVTNAQLEEFGKVYFKLSQELLGKNEAQATMATVVINSRIKKIAGNPSALQKVANDIGTFIEKAPDEVVQEHAQALDYLTTKLDEYLKEDITAESL